ncbi:MAG TPA: Gfo/Idh/MocA family oxidoreductase [Candidatus Eisenbacteria bacterium]|nr:Gfo/Idh/MocA family oxidoreductase [Candidatus Eisenbacteria bacterium]
MSALRVAVVGLGWVGTHRHLPLLRATPDVQVVGVIDHSVARVEQARAAFRVPRGAAADDPSGVPWLDEVDAVTIATPPSTHDVLARAYLLAGKDVLLEKPMALEVGAARELAELATSRGRVLAVVHNFQFARSTLRLRRLLAAGKLGEVRALWGAQLSNPQRRLPDWYESLPLGLFYDESPHFFYLVRSLLGAQPVLDVAHRVPSPEGRRTPASITLLMRAGSVPVQIAMNFESPVSEWHIALIGSERMAVLDIFRDALVVIPNDHQHLGRNVLATTAHAITTHLVSVAGSGVRTLAGRLAYGNDVVIARFVEACRTRVPPKDISAGDGLDVVRLQHAVLDRVRPDPS